MSESTGLAQHHIIGFVPIHDAERAKIFYRDTLGLPLISDELPFALVFSANGIMLRLTMTPDAPPSRGTVLGWQVPNIAAAVKDLSQAGVCFERYPPMAQDAWGIWTSPNGAKVAWFNDPDGNILSLTEFPAG